MAVLEEMTRRCMSVSCPDIEWKLLLVGGCFKPCGLCNKRRLFKRVVKCRVKLIITPKIRSVN